MTGAPSRAGLGRERSLALLEEADDALDATLGTLQDGPDGEPALAHPSLCAGWSRGHVVAHLARNADALTRLVGWAVTGQEVAGYDSPEARDRDIEQGARMPLPRLRADLARASAAFGRSAQALRGVPPWGLASVRTAAASPPMPGDRIPWARLREVTLHHVDLDAGFTLADASPDVLDAALEEALLRLAGRPGCPGVTLLAADGRRWALAGGGPRVRGDTAGLLLWLARGIPSGGAGHDGFPVPALPSWG